ncbi:acyl-CoA ligase (AMP-forming), exosortase A system-associated [Methylovulum psychrotolerans]|uniref:acyl-CoA ligase (AMP-forming), exosortase A system-associated n=1 Tax=Methylovulum psychrotolerans TaxID=1704499 RepID=UPI001BFEF1B1|nr:acyl-CoA ligase (AMP-forming), exosortase A system-associated [Methylovulum psychrotolerans]MBT9096267.1 acyl-CoA ligase (AMP-forming), exosortase A system-associated [Methylovulum psychrotolerans]
MPTLLHHLLSETQALRPDAEAIVHKKTAWTYTQLHTLVGQQARALQAVGLQPQQRVAVYLAKQIETVSSFLAVSQAGGVFVPVNPVLKAAQVGYILSNCNVTILITSKNRLAGVAEVLAACPDLHTVIITEAEEAAYPPVAAKAVFGWQAFLAQAADFTVPPTIDTDMAAILYTSGSTGKPKGVVISHRNLITGAYSVSEYLGIGPTDRLLAVLPFSFDYGLNQFTTALLKGGCCVLLDYLLPRDVVLALALYRITGLAAVPPLWAQLANVNWPDGINSHLRYMTNSGGKMPKAILATIRAKVPDARFFLMYGLTEAFRSTYLPPEQIDLRPDSMGKAIPNAEIVVVREDGSLCAAHEPGELVHRGSLVAMGYWNDPETTAARFKPAPGQLPQLPLTEIAVWSGDTVTRDEEGYLYFVGRKDDMIKTSGYRVSPSEIEEVVYTSGLVKEAAALGIAHDSLGQAVVVVVSAEEPDSFDAPALLAVCKNQLPNFMVPAKIIALPTLPRNPNGKIDRKALTEQFAGLFQTGGAS